MGKQLHRYRVVDVFTSVSLEGNPLAVFPDASGMGSEVMQKIAKELNLAETAFVLPATQEKCAAKVRIFTPTKEMRFAGHPTIGTAFVLVDEGMVSKDSDRFKLEENVGPVPVKVELGSPPLYWLMTPPISFGRLFERRRCAEVLALETDDLLPPSPQLLDAGNPTVFIAVKNKEAVDRAWLDLRGMRILRGDEKQLMCVFVFTPTAEGAYSRMFAPEYGIVEDPATGSSTGPLAAYMLQHGLLSGVLGERFVSEQGTKMGRRSILHVRVKRSGNLEIEVGGTVTPLVEATMTLGQD